MTAPWMGREQGCRAFLRTTRHEWSGTRGGDGADHRSRHRFRRRCVYSQYSVARPIAVNGHPGE